jgi:hypothetical protein
MIKTSSATRWVKQVAAVVSMTVAAVAAGGCSSVDDPSSVPGEAAASQGIARGRELVGVWKFVYEGQRRADVEAKLAAEIQDPAALAAAKREAEAEAAASEIEFTADGWFFSRIGSKEIARHTYTSERVSDDAVRLSTLDEGARKSTEVTLLEDGKSRRISIFDPAKGALVFEKK